MSRLLTAMVPVAVLILATPASAQQSGLGPVTQIRTVSASAVAQSSADGLGPMNQYVFRNDADVALTAWKFRCVQVLADGRSGWSGQSTDSFGTVTAPYLPGLEVEREDRFVQPGEELTIGAGGAPTDKGPYAATTCGMVAVVFEDGSHYGAPEILEEIFSSRRALVGDMLATLQVVESIASGKSGARETEDLLARLEGTPGADLYGKTLQEIRVEAERSGRLPQVRLRTFEERIRRNVQEARNHLRPEDLVKLGVEG